jgi:hypothetical protein
MIKICAAVVALGVGLAGFSSAQAAHGCGWGAHRVLHGGCRPIGSGPAVMAPVQAIAPARVVITPLPGGVMHAPRAPICPYGYHLGPERHRCRPN